MKVRVCVCACVCMRVCAWSFELIEISEIAHEETGLPLESMKKQKKKGTDAKFRTRCTLCRTEQFIKNVYLLGRRSGPTSSFFVPSKLF